MRLLARALLRRQQVRMQIDDRSFVVRPVSASSADLIEWPSINWARGNRMFGNLQMRIAKAVEILPA